MSLSQKLQNLIKGHGKQSRSVPSDPVKSPHANNQKVEQEKGNYSKLNANMTAQKTSQAIHGHNILPAHDGQNIRGSKAVDRGAHLNEQQVKKTPKIDKEELARMVAEENKIKGKLPQYPGLERWQLIEKMGDGAFSNVYRARDLQGKAGEVAIKVVRKFEMNSSQGDARLHPDFKKQPKVVERVNILKEVSIMRGLDHPNIIKLVDFSESKQFYYIILELAPGGELFHQIVRLTYFSEDLSRHVIVQVARALEYLHEEKGVVHRDIKPENLLFSPIPIIPTKNPKAKSPEDEEKMDEGEFVPGLGAGGIGQIKIADFGLSKIVWESSTMTPCGTVGYTAPEIVKDERYSKSVDMWAMGCVLYTLLCGFPPFYDESIQLLTEKVAKGQYTFLSPWWDEISKSAQDLVSHLLTVDPAKRYTIKEFLAHPWIRNSKEPTYAAMDAPPLATPAVERQAQLGGPLRAFQPDILQAQGGRRMDFRSPGAVNLREVFDVGYAVHRQEEEAKARKNFGPAYRGAAAMNILNPIDDEEEFSEEESGVTSKNVHSDLTKVEQDLKSIDLSTSRSQQQRSTCQQGGSATKPRSQNRSGMFELNLEGATLLSRRGIKGPSSLRETMIAQ
ncbi:BgTH12-01637 [Blumeria graminis f. sp. triticale]|uniref:BgTH12-01637 n=1 Tax=Blumeria graminis f. sp. triticale TaxID=1689686 RepID=A0A9W4CYT9_BLUGR|nr:BgTH12-01637 [Blumeria graminis f. sp. triticale]